MSALAAAPSAPSSLSPPHQPTSPFKPHHRGLTTRDWAGDSATLTILEGVNPVLRLVQRASAASFAVFGLVHLSAPLSALLPSTPRHLSSAENRANGVLLIGRELYQGEWTEPVLVWGSLSAHVLSGITLRWLKVLERIERRKVRREEVKHRARELATVKADEFPSHGFEHANEAERDLAIDEVDEFEAELVAMTTEDEELVVPSAVPAATGALFPLPNVHQRTGYLLLPFVLHHAWMHRLLPASPFPPILSLSPSFFNYSFTSLAVNHDSLILRAGSAFSYAALTGLATYHGLVGARILLSPIAPRSLAPRRKHAGERDSLRRRITHGREWQAVWVALVTGVAVGTARIAGYLGGENGGVRTPEFVARRMEHVLRRGFAQA